MRKVFISQGMSGRANSEILAERRLIMAMIRQDLADSELEEVDSFIENPPTITSVNDNAVWYLGHSVQKLAEADLAVFVPGWETKRGCQVERQVCHLYHIPAYEMGEDGHFELIGSNI